MRSSLKVFSAAVLLFALSTPAFALYKFNPFTGKQDYYETGASGAITVTTIDTGQGANEVYDMDQNVLTTSTPTFSTLTVADEAYDATNWDADLTVPTKNAVRDKIEALSIVSPFTTAANLTYLTTTTDNLAVGGSTNLGKVTIDGDTDEIQLVVQGNATQTSDIFLVEKSDGTDLFKVANDGTVTSSGSGTEALTLGSGSQATYVLTANLSGTDVTQTYGSASLSIGSAAFTAGSIAAFSLTGAETLSENTSIALDPAGSADGKYSGITVTGTGGATIAFGDLVTLDKDDSRWELVDISVAAAATGDARGILGMAVTSSTDGGALTVLLHGIIRADANFPTLTIGAPVYASTTGDIVVTQPTTTDHVIRVVGFAMTADELYFDPSQDYTTHT